VQRIESKETGRGIPDLYVRTPDKEYWVELKNAPYSSIHWPVWNVHWRVGQQAWAMQYRRITGSPTFTVVAMKDGFLWIPMLKVFKNNEVTHDDVTRADALRDILSLIK
jgi:hypothetical protein